MILILKSDNENLSFLLQKNPNSELNGFVCEEYKNGVMSHFYNGPQESISFFKDKPEQISFKEYADQEYEHLTSTSFNSCLAALHIAINYYKDIFSLSDKVKDYDVESNHSLIIPSIRLNNKMFLEHFQNHFNRFEIEILDNHTKFFELKLSTREKTTLHEFINYVVLFLIINATYEDSFFLEKGMVEKYANIFKRLDVPYYIAYRFKTIILKGLNDYRKYKTMLEESVSKFHNVEVKFEYGDTHKQRIDDICSLINFDKPILDYGCGEGKHIKRYIKKTKKSDIVGYDIDENIIKRNKKYGLFNECDNLKFTSSLEGYNFEDYNVVVSEVIEHVELENVETFLKHFVDDKRLNSFSKLIITTPNVEFNEYYKLDVGERHDDHKFEWTSEEFQKRIQKVFTNHNIEFFQIGDSVNNITPTQGVIIKNENYA